MRCNHVYKSANRMLKKTESLHMVWFYLSKAQNQAKLTLWGIQTLMGKTIKKIKHMIISKVKIATSGRSITKTADLVLHLDLNVSYIGIHFIITLQVVHSSLCTFLFFVSLVFHSKNVLQKSKQFWSTWFVNKSESSQIKV